MYFPIALSTKRNEGNLNPRHITTLRPKSGKERRLYWVRKISGSPRPPRVAPQVKTLRGNQPIFLHSRPHRHAVDLCRTSVRARGHFWTIYNQHRCGCVGWAKSVDRHGRLESHLRSRLWKATTPFFCTQGRIGMLPTFATRRYGLGGTFRPCAPYLTVGG